MGYAEKTLYCYHCKKNFTFTVEDQEYRSSQGYPNDPLNCPACRLARNTYSAKQTQAHRDFNPTWHLLR